MNLIKTIHQHLTEEITKINALILDHLKTSEELIEQVAKYLINAGGKRMRPILTILSSKMCGYKGNNNIKLATAVEFIHVATLLHDDVVDSGKMRRFKPTANAIWGNNASILVGDFLFSQAFKLMVATESISALQILSQASSVIIEGEVAQLTMLNKKRIITVDEYQNIINAKTAELFGASCQVGGVIANQSTDVCTNLRQFGVNLGGIFQIIDDWLDYVGKDSEMGKNIGSDFAEGKVTIPLILLHQKLSARDQEKLEQLIQLDKRDADDFACIQELMSQYPIEDQIINILNDLKLNAVNALYKINYKNEYKDYLMHLLDFAMTRSY